MLVLKKIYLITCPTKQNYFFLKKINFVNDTKIEVLFDPIISPKAIIKDKPKYSSNVINYLLAIKLPTKILFFYSRFLRNLISIKIIRLLLSERVNKKN